MLRERILDGKHFRLGDVVEFVAEKTTSTGKSVRKVNKDLYKYIQIQDIGFGDYKSVEYRGWELPDRAKHFAEPGDLFIGAIWGSVTKWCLIPNECDNLVITNGCHRLRIKPGQDKCLIDLIAFLCTEAYAVQMRAFARGSDGLAEVTEDDTAGVSVIELDDKQRERIRPFVDSLQSGTPDVKSKIATMVKLGELNYPQPPKRPSHVVLV